MIEKYIGDFVDIKPKWLDIKIIFITTSNSKPLFVFTYKDYLYFGICNYKFGFLENFDDFILLNGDSFNSFFPGEEEFNFLERLEPIYYKMNYLDTMKGDLDEFSEYELNLIRKYHRESILKELLS